MATSRLGRQCPRFPASTQRRLGANKASLRSESTSYMRQMTEPDRMIPSRRKLMTTNNVGLRGGPGHGLDSEENLIVAGRGERDAAVLQGGGEYRNIGSEFAGCLRTLRRCTSQQEYPSTLIRVPQQANCCERLSCSKSLGGWNVLIRLPCLRALVTYDLLSLDRVVQDLVFHLVGKQADPGVRPWTANENVVVVGAQFSEPNTAGRRTTISLWFLSARTAILATTSASIEATLSPRNSD